MTTREFGDFTDSTNAAVTKWEKCGDDVTMMSSSTEKMLRLQILERVGVESAKFLQVFKKMNIDRKQSTLSIIQLSL